MHDWSDRPEKNNVRVVDHLRSARLSVDVKQAFETATGLLRTLSTPREFQPPLDGAKRRNPFCARMAPNNKSSSACLKFHAKVEAETNAETRTSLCNAGPIESNVPVLVGTALVGYFQTGQAFFERPENKRFAETIGTVRSGDGEVVIRELILLYGRTQLVAKRQYEAYLGLLASLAQHLAKMSNEVLMRGIVGELPVIVQARAFMLAHTQDHIHLRDVARAASLSAHYFCRIFRQVTGFAFATYLARVRVALVKDELLSPHVRVCESAYAAGFKSPPQFNRVFRRIVDEPPSHFRAQFARHVLTSPSQTQPNGKPVTQMLCSPAGPLRNRRASGAEARTKPPRLRGRQGTRRLKEPDGHTTGLAAECARNPSPFHTLPYFTMKKATKVLSKSNDRKSGEVGKTSGRSCSSGAPSASAPASLRLELRPAPQLAVVETLVDPPAWAQHRRARFGYFNPEAREVFLVGTFNDWNLRATPLKQELFGDWSVELDLSPGEYHYRFYVDGVWKDDPTASNKTPNPYGGFNMVIDICD